MGLRSTLAKAVGSAFIAVGDIAESGTYRRTASVYNTSTGTNVITNTDYIIDKVVWTKFDNFEIDRISILGSDVKVLFQTSKLSITPNIATDQMVRADGKIYNILRVSKDPAGAVYTLQLRSPS
jgi:hypothetical protein